MTTFFPKEAVKQNFVVEEKKKKRAEKKTLIAVGIIII